MVAIVAPPAIVEIKFGINEQQDRLSLPRDFRDASLDEIIPYLPADLRQMPRWALQGMLLVPIIGFSAQVKSTRFITSTSTSTQTDNVDAAWNSANNTIQIVSHAGSPSSSGAGGGGYAKVVNGTLTPGGTATFRLAPAGNGNDDAHADWYGGASLALSLVGIRGGSNAGGSAGAGASVTNAIGSTVFRGGNGSSLGSFSCCDSEPGAGGGAAGPHGAGGDAVAPSSGTPGVGGTGESGNTATGANGTQFDATHGSGGGSQGGTAGLYGGASSGSGTSQPGLIVITNNAA